MTQLAFPFADAVEQRDRVNRPSAYRKRLARVAALAFELGKRRGTAASIARCMPRPPRSLGAAVVDLPRPVYLSRDDRNEIAALAKRVERLAPRGLPHREKRDRRGAAPARAAWITA